MFRRSAWLGVVAVLVGGADACAAPVEYRALPLPATATLGTSPAAPALAGVTWFFSQFSVPLGTVPVTD
jgi:hypothetical protein